MKRNMLFYVATVVVLLSVILSACVTPTQAPAVKSTEAPKPTDVPVVAFAPMKQEVADCAYGGNVKGIEAVDELTVKITLCASDPAFLAKIAVPAFQILDKDYLDKTGGDAAKINEAPVGTGPYILKEWVRGDHLTFVPNPNYWGPAPKNKEFILKWNKEAAARLLDLQSGNISGMDNVGTDDYAAVEADANLVLYPRKFNNFLYLATNNLIPPYDDVRVRKAFAMAIDRQRIVDNYYPKGASAATQFIPPGVKPGFTDGFEAFKYDPVAAKALLTEAGFDFDKEYVLSYAERTRPYFPQPTKIAQEVQAQLAEIGVKIKLELMEWAAYLPATRNGEKGLFFLGWSEDFPDATNWYDVFLTGSSKSFGNPFPEIVEQIKIGASNADPVVRQAAYDKVNKLYSELVPVIVLTNGATSLAFNKDIKNVVVGPYNENFTEMESANGQIVFSQDGEPVSMYCADETDGSSFRACLQIYDNLYEFEYGSTALKPGLAEKCEANAEGTVWTCTLRKNVKFSNGAALDANDVVASFINMWDYKSPNRKGNTGVYQYWKDFFGPKALNEPAQ